MEYFTNLGKKYKNLSATTKDHEQPQQSQKSKVESIILADIKLYFKIIEIKEHDTIIKTHTQIHEGE